MISLSDIESWTKLNHAYGEASDIPELLQKLADYPTEETYKSEPYYSLWSALCHQGDVYSASYAALPYIIHYIEENPKEITSSYVHLPLQIEISRFKEHGPKIDSDLETEYFRALKNLLHLVPEISSNPKVSARILSATVAIINGNHQLGDLILELPSDLIPECKEWIEQNA